MAGTGLPKKTAAALTYVLGWVTGIIFLIVEKDSFVRFHAAQSVVTFGILTIIVVIPFLWFFVPIVWIVGFVLWLVLLYKAYQGEEFKLPWVGDLAKKLLGKI